MNLASPRVVNIKDLRRLARARLPDAVFDYLDGAADDEVTLKDSERAYQEVIFKPRFAVATPACDLSVTVLGQKLDLPFVLGPIGYSRLMHPRGAFWSAERGLLHVPGSWLPMVLILALFAIKYTVGVSLAMHPALAHEPLFAGGFSLAYGLFSGLFAAKGLSLRRLATRPVLAQAAA
jgi:hypothetical protein